MTDQDELLFYAKIALQCAVSDVEVARLFGVTYLRCFCDLIDAVSADDEERVGELLQALANQTAMLAIDQALDDKSPEADEVIAEAEASGWMVKGGEA